MYVFLLMDKQVLEKLTQWKEEKLNKQKGLLFYILFAFKIIKII